MGFLNVLAVGVGAVAILIWQKESLKNLNYWVRTEKLDRKNFQAADYNVLTDIPTTYYEPGKLGDVLKEWDHRWHLYRVAPGKEFKFDSSILNTDILARELDYSCLNSESVCNKMSVMNPSCIFDLNNTFGHEEVIPASKILTPEGYGWHASFATMQNKKVVADLWDQMQIPVKLSSTNFEHAFVSHLKQDAITAGFHANPATDSMAVTFVGHKTWLFLPSNVYRDSMEAKFGASTIFYTKSAPKNVKSDMYVYHSQPGDVLFFPESWGHAVYTYKGPNFMINYRHMWLGNIFHQPLTWFSAIFFNTLFRDTTTNKNKEAKDIIKNKAFAAVPFKNLNVKIVDMFRSMCEEGGPVEFDTQAIDILTKEVAKYKSANPHLK